MKASKLHLVRLTALLQLATFANASNVVLSNDDGWAEINVRTFFDHLNAVGNSVILSAPASDQSGTSSLDLPPTPRLTACQFNSCPAFSPATGSNSSNPRLNYVNSFPATSIKYGIDTLAPQIFGGLPEFAVTGPNVGSNLGISVFFSGTVGAANKAVSSGIPAIAFSGASGNPTAWNVPNVPSYAQVYADLATNVTQTILASGKPYLPPDTFLNVNFPKSGDGGVCTSPTQFKFVLSRIISAINGISAADVQTCGGTRLPSENDVVGTTTGCFASISVGKVSTKTDADAAAQAIVLGKLKGILSCLR